MKVFTLTFAKGLKLPCKTYFGGIKLKKTQKKLLTAIVSLFFAALMTVSAFAYGSSIQPVRPEIDFDRQAYVYNEDMTLFYRFKTPTYYDGTRKYPLILYLHGLGENGNDNKTQLNTISSFFRNTESENAYETFFVVPQLPKGEGWTGEWADATFKLLEEILRKYPVDRDRVYVLGYSNGGYGTWNFLSLRGELFAAGSPICGWYNTSAARRLSKIPIYVFHGSEDTIVYPQNSRNMVNAIKAYGENKIFYTEYIGLAHNVWDQGVSYLMETDWLYKYKLSDREPTRPVATLTDVTAKPGEAFTTTLKFEKCNSEGTYETLVNYNKNIMRFLSASGDDVSATVVSDGQLRVVLNNPEKETTLRFVLKPKMEDGVYSLVTIPQTIYGGKFILNSDCELTIYENLPGDCNDDRIVDEKDAVMLGRYLAGWNVEINENAADVKKDEVVSEQDYVMLSRYLAGYDLSFVERK